MNQVVGLTPPLVEALREIARGLKKNISVKACETLLASGYIERQEGSFNLTVRGQRYLNALARRKKLHERRPDGGRNRRD